MRYYPVECLKYDCVFHLRQTDCVGFLHELGRDERDGGDTAAKLKPHRHWQVDRLTSDFFLLGPDARARSSVASETEIDKC